MLKNDHSLVSILHEEKKFQSARRSSGVRCHRDDLLGLRLQYSGVLLLCVTIQSALYSAIRLLIRNDLLLRDCTFKSAILAFVLCANSVFS